MSVGACATVGGPATSAHRSTSRSAETLRDWQQLQDSITAQNIADEQGPRVSIRADFTSYADSRRVEAWFDVKDDAYIFVGHIDANGNVTALFPEKPDDDGFVRGGKSYHTMPVFAGFESEYSWKRANYYSQIATSRSRTESYDYGTGYMFIVASWRPMRFDRISENGRWSAFELADDEYLLRDVRPAVGELASLLAGDNREAYTVEFAKYYRTNFSQGAYAMSSFRALDCLFGYSAFGSLYMPAYGYNPYAYSGFGFPFGGYYFSPFGTSAFGCGRGHYAYGSYGYGRPYAYSPNQPAPPVTSPSVRPFPRTPVVPPRVGRPDSLRPASPQPGGNAQTPALQPAPRLRASDDLLRPRDARPANGYRERGLITDDNAPGAPRPRIAGEAQRPSIIDMVGRRREEMGSFGDRNGSVERYGQPRNRRESIDMPGRAGTGSRRDGSSYPAAGMSAPRGASSAPRGGESRPISPRPSAPRDVPSHHPSSGGGGGETRSAPSSPPPRMQPAPASSPRAAPASRPEPIKPRDP